MIFVCNNNNNNNNNYYYDIGINYDWIFLIFLKLASDSSRSYQRSKRSKYWSGKLGCHKSSEVSQFLFDNLHHLVVRGVICLNL